LAGSRPIFPGLPGERLINGLPIENFDEKRLIFNQFDTPGQVHIYKADCRAGERLRAQMFVPVLPRGGTAVPAFAIIGQSLPYSADAQKLPVDLPKGYSAIVAPSPSQLVQPVEDILTRARYYAGPIIDTRTLVGGKCYLAVWSPHNHMGKYVIQTGHRWPLRATYWASIPLIWWRIRGWFGLNRSRAVSAAIGGAVVVGLLTAWLLKKK
jgi:hypothetical protein